MARPRTKSKPKPKPAKPEPEVAPVRVGRCTGLDVPEAKAEKIVSDIDVEDMVKRMIKRIENAINSGVEVKNKDLYSDLTHTLARYHAESVEAEDEPMLKAA